LCHNLHGAPEYLCRAEQNWEPIRGVNYKGPKVVHNVESFLGSKGRENSEKIQLNPKNKKKIPFVNRKDWGVGPGVVGEWFRHTATSGEWGTCAPEGGRRRQTERPTIGSQANKGVGSLGEVVEKF